MIITVSSVGGSPGVTSWATLLAAAWPPEVETDRVVVEADLDGAVMGARFGIGVDPGSATLVSTARRAVDSSIDLADIGRLVDPRVWLIPGPESAEAARQLWATPSASESVASAAARDHRLWLFDVGRAGPNGQLAPIFERSMMSVLMCRAEHDSLVQVPARVSALKKAKCTIGVLVVGTPAFSIGDLQRFFGADTAWVTDESNDLVVASRHVWSQRRVRRSQLWRSAVTVATEIAAVVQSRSMPVVSRDREAFDGR